MMKLTFEINSNKKTTDYYIISESLHLRKFRLKSTSHQINIKYFCKLNI